MWAAADVEDRALELAKSPERAGVIAVFVADVDLWGLGVGNQEVTDERLEGLPLGCSVKGRGVGHEVPKTTLCIAFELRTGLVNQVVAIRLQRGTVQRRLQQFNGNLIVHFEDG